MNRRRCRNHDLRARAACGRRQKPALSTRHLSTISCSALIVSTAQNFDPNKVQMSRLLSIKTRRMSRGLRLLQPVGPSCDRAQGLQADGGRARGCRGDARRRRRRRHALLHGRGLAQARRQRDMDALVAMVEGVKALGMETCMTLGMLIVETSRKARSRPASTTTTTTSTRPSATIGEIITTRTFADRLETLGQCPRGRHQGLLRRHCRHGRDGRGPRRHAGDAGQSAGAIPKACRSTC